MAAACKLATSLLDFVYNALSAAFGFFLPLGMAFWYRLWGRGLSWELLRVKGRTRIFKSCSWFLLGTPLLFSGYMVLRCG